jgi:hypothetical protein
MRKRLHTDTTKEHLAADCGGVGLLVRTRSVGVPDQRAAEKYMHYNFASQQKQLFY